MQAGLGRQGTHRPGGLRLLQARVVQADNMPTWQLLKTSETSETSFAVPVCPSCVVVFSAGRFTRR